MLTLPCKKKWARIEAKSPRNHKITLLVKLLIVSIKKCLALWQSTFFKQNLPEFGISRLKEHKLFSILNIVSFQSLRFVVKEAICSQCCDHIHDEVVDRPVP